MKNHTLLRILLPVSAAAALLCFLFFRQTFDASKPVTKSTFLLDTVISITLYQADADALIQECFSLCEAYESRLSRTIETSEISIMNNRENQDTFTVSEDTAWLLARGYYYSSLSDGSFDITIEPLSSLWDFKAESAGIPSAQQLLDSLPKIGYRNLVIDKTQITFSSPDTRLDLGAIAKGYIADCLKTFLVERGVTSGIINLGGNILCIGSKPDGNPYQIGIQKPFENRNELITTVDIRDMSVVSSGIYERYLVQDDILYHHILDPKSGYPYDNGLISVTILSPFSVDGDALSTTCFALGLTKGMELIDSLEDIYALFITDDYELHYSKDFPLSE